MGKAKGKGKRSKPAQTAAQKRAQADFKAFREDHGRGPRAGESIKGYATGNRKNRVSRALGRLGRSVRKHPFRTLFGALTVGAAGAATTESGREALGNAKDRVAAVVRPRGP